MSAKGKGTIVSEANSWAAEVPIRKHRLLLVQAVCGQAHGNIMGLKYITGLRQCCRDQLLGMLL